MFHQITRSKLGETIYASWFETQGRCVRTPFSTFTAQKCCVTRSTFQRKPFIWRKSQKFRLKNNIFLGRLPGRLTKFVSLISVSAKWRWRSSGQRRSSWNLFDRRKTWAEWGQKLIGIFIVLVKIFKFNFPTICSWSHYPLKFDIFHKQIHLLVFCP